MSKLNQTTKDEPKKQSKPGHKQPNLNEQLGEQPVAPGLSDHFLLGTEGFSGQGPSTRLFDKPFLPAQRQALAVRLGQIGGNQYLSRMIQQVNQKQRKTEDVDDLDVKLPEVEHKDDPAKREQRVVDNGPLQRSRTEPIQSSSSSAEKEEGICPECGRVGKGVCSCGQPFRPIQRWQTTLANHDSSEAQHWQQVLDNQPAQHFLKSQTATVQRTCSDCEDELRPKPEDDSGENVVEPTRQLQSAVFAGDTYLNDVLNGQGGGPLLIAGSGAVTAIKRLQKALLVLTPSLDLGQSGVAGVDGDFGTKTEASVQTFQQEFGLTSDGIIGPQTLATLDGALKRVWSQADEPSKIQVRESTDDAQGQPELYAPVNASVELIAAGSGRNVPGQRPVEFKLIDGLPGMKIEQPGSGATTAQLYGPADVKHLGEAFSVEATWTTIASPPTTQSQRTPGRVKNKHPVDVAMVLDADDVARARSFAPNARILVAETLNEMQQQLRDFDAPIGTLFIFSHASVRGSLKFAADTPDWRSVDEVAGLLNGVVRANAINLQGCSIGGNLPALETLRAALGARAIMAGTCFRVSEVTFPIECSDDDGSFFEVMSRTQFKKPGVKECFKEGFRELIDTLGPKQDCVVGGATENNYFAKNGRLPVAWFNPDLDENFIPGKSICVEAAARISGTQQELEREDLSDCRVVNLRAPRARRRR